MYRHLCMSHILPILRNFVSDFPFVWCPICLGSSLRIIIICPDISSRTRTKTWPLCTVQSAPCTRQDPAIQLYLTRAELLNLREIKPASAKNTLAVKITPGAGTSENHTWGNLSPHSQFWSWWRHTQNSDQNRLGHFECQNELKWPNKN